MFHNITCIASSLLMPQVQEETDLLMYVQELQGLTMEINRLAQDELRRN